MSREQSLTSGPGGRILTNANVWSPDGDWIVYDERSDAAGSNFDGTRIWAIHTQTGERKCLYQSRHGACCGVVSWHPSLMRVAFILGPEHPTDNFRYGPDRRRGVMVDFDRPGEAISLDARDLVAPYTPGALRGGSHVHIFHPQGRHLSFTYEDHILAMTTDPKAEPNRRTIAVSLLDLPVTVPAHHLRNHSGTAFSVVVVRTTAAPTPGSDEIARAIEEGWVGHDGYLRADGTRQRMALAFQGEVIAASGQPVWEVFIVDLPDDLTRPGEGPLAGSATTAPRPPHGTTQRRLTFTCDEPYPGIAGPRHWLRSNPQGTRIGFYRKDRRGVVQFWTVSPQGGSPVQVTDHPFSIESAFTWHPSGDSVFFVADGRVCRTEISSGRTISLTEPGGDPIRPEACVVSPRGDRVAFVRRGTDPAAANQIHIVDVE